MTRVGFFEIDPMFTLDHWKVVLGNRFFIEALRTTLILSATTAVVSPLLFSVVGYIIARTRWRGRGVLDSLLWSSSAIPGILASLGLMWAFLRTPGLEWLFGTIWALLIVTILQSQLLSTQLAKGAYLQIGVDMEEAARTSGAGWVRTYFKIWLPLIMPTMVLIGVINFVASVQATSNIILIADRDTTTMSILALQMMTADDVKLLEEAGIVSIVLIGLTARCRIGRTEVRPAHGRPASLTRTVGPSRRQRHTGIGSSLLAQLYLRLGLLPVGLLPETGHGQLESSRNGEDRMQGRRQAYPVCQGAGRGSQVHVGCVCVSS